MGRNIGEVDFIVDFDGRGLPGKARQLGNEMGEAGGEGYREGFSSELTTLSKELRDQMDRDGDLAGSSFTDSMQNVIRRNKQSIADELAGIFGKKSGLADFVNQTGDVDTALSRVRDSMRELNEAGGLSTQMYDNLSIQVDDFAESNRRAVVEQDRVRTAMRGIQMDLADELDGRRRLNESIEENSRSFDRHRFSIRRLLPTLADFDRGSTALGRGLDRLTSKLDRSSAGAGRFKQSFRFNQLPEQLQDIIVIGTIIAALGTDIAVLGSAAGGGLAAIGIGALALGTGVGVMIAGLKGITGPLEDIAPAARPAAAELQKLGKQFVEMKKSIQGRLFADLAPDISNLGDKLLPILSRGFDKAADAGNRFFRQLAQRLTTPKALEDMDRLLTGFEPILDSLFTTLINLGAGIGSVFVVGLPTAQKFFGYIERITGEFARWSESDEGRSRIAKWFETAERIGPVVARVIGTLGDTLASLVTSETIGKLESALEGIDNLIPSIGRLLAIIGNLDPIGIFVAALTTIRDILSPLSTELGELATTLGGDLKGRLGDIGSKFSEVAGNLKPFVTAVTEDLLPALTGEDGLLAALIELGGNILDDLTAGDTLPAVARALTSAADAATDLTDELGPLFDLFTPIVADAIKNVATALTLLTTPIEDLDELFADKSYKTDAQEFIDFYSFGFGTEIVKTIATGIVGTRVILAEFKKLFDFSDAKLDGTAFSKKVDAMFRGIGEAIGKSWEWLKTFVANLFLPGDLVDGDDLGPTMDGEGMRADIGDFFDDVGQWFSEAWENTKEFVSGLFTDGGIFDFSEATLDGGTAEPAIAGLWEDITGYFQDGFDGIKEWFTGLSFSSIFDELFAGAPLAAQTSATGMSDAFKPTPGNIELNLGSMTDLFGRIFGAAPAPVQQAALDVASAFSTTTGTITGYLGDIGTRIGGFFDSAPGLTRNVATQVGSIWATPPTTITGFMGNIGMTIAAFFNPATPNVQVTRDRVQGLWSTVRGNITGTLSGIGEAIASPFRTAIGGVQSVVGSIVGAFTSLPSRILGTLQGIGARISAALDFSNIRVRMPTITPPTLNLPRTAIGGVFGTGQARIIGEAGPEAVVPLRRPLSQVDPAVRALSAFAQGKGESTSNAGSIERQYNIEEGAVQVITAATNPDNVGGAVVDNIVAALP